MHATLLTFLLVVGTACAVAQDGATRLRYVVPDGWTPGIDGRTLLPPGGNAAVTFLPSIAFAGSAEQWMNESWNRVSREAKLLSGPAPGMQGAFLTRIGLFQQNDGTRAWLCLNTLVQDGRGEGVIYLARDDAQFRADLPALSKLLQQITVVPLVGPPSVVPPAGSGATPASPPPTPPTAGGNDVAGLYLATTRQLRFNPLGGAGSADWEMRTEFYLLSREGRVFRGRDLPSVPGGLSRFDYDAARRAAPGNSGSYSVRGHEVVMRFPDENLLATGSEPGVLDIRGTKFRRSGSEGSGSTPSSTATPPAATTSPGKISP